MHQFQHRVPQKRDHRIVMLNTVAHHANIKRACSAEGLPRLLCDKYMGMPSGSVGLMMWDLQRTVPQQ